PTIKLGTNERVIQVPLSPSVSKNVERFRIPTNVQLDYREFLGAEQQLLRDLSEELDATSKALALSSTTLTKVRAVLSNEIPDSLTTTRESLNQTSQLISTWTARQIPDLRTTLSSQQQQLSQAETAFAELQSLPRWIFALAAMAPASLLLQGFFQLRGSLRAGD
ncbi:MAG: hypothetical protein KDB22_24825, partial [Planctomycetales bacterium]|nr:hypothetical protein [Planctomycetales bacterium]